MQSSLDRRLATLGNRLASLPEADEPPPTTLQVLGRSHQERDWQQLLVYLLTPDEAHGLGHAMLEHLLRELSDRDDLDYTFSRFDLDDIELEQEVVTARGRPDVVVWCAEDWFLCCELKIDSTEGNDQTSRYVGVNSFRSIDLEKADVPADGHHYLYLAPEDAPPPEADEFVHVAWEWVATELQSFLGESRGAYPARTTAQIQDFTDTIRAELTMTEYQENENEKARLYVDHYDEIRAVQTAFDEQWTEFTRSWGTRLVQALDTAEPVDDDDPPTEYVPLRLTMDDGTRRRWTLWQGNDDWAWMVPEGWWTKLDEGRTAYTTAKPNARVGFLHRLDWHRENALRDHELVFYLRNAPSGYKAFYDGFAERFNAAGDVLEYLPAATTRPGVKSNVLEARYDIDVEAHEEFFAAYVQALAEAMTDHVVSNPGLVSVIDRIYDETIKEDVSL